MHVTGFRRHYTSRRTGFIRNASFDLTLKLLRNESSRFLLCAAAAVQQANFTGSALLGHCTEVSSSIWHYSWWHAVTALGGIFLVFAEVALFLNTGDIDFE
jgi:hypothetical protein